MIEGRSVGKRGSWATDWKKSSALFLCASLVSFQVAADPIQLGVGLQERYSDNVRLTHTNPKADLQSRLYLTMRQHSGPGKCQSNLRGEVGFSKYQRNTYSDRTDANANLAGDCQLANNFRWNALDNISQIAANNALPNTPTNSVKRNIFSTGPSWTWLMTPRDALSLSSSYQKTNFWGNDRSITSVNTHDRDSYRLLGSANLSHKLDPSFSVGVGGNVSRTVFKGDETLIQRSGNLNTRKSFATTKFTGSVGYSTLDDTIGGITNHSGGPIWQAKIDRQINEHSRWYFSYGREFTDTTSTYVLQVAGLNFNYRDTSAVRITSYRFGYKNQLNRGSQLSATLGRDESDHLRTGNNDITDLVDLSLSEPLSANWSALTGLGYQHQQLDLTNITNNTVNAYLGTNYQRTKALSFNARLGHNLRHSNVSYLSYAENFIQVGLRYDFR